MSIKFPFAVLPPGGIDVVGFGVNAVDYLIRVPEYPAVGSKIELTSYSQAAGGEVASTLVGLQRLGFNTAYAGRFGSDPEGVLGLRSLKDEGVDVRYGETVEGARTQIAFILIDEPSGERTVIWHRDPKLAYGVDLAPPIEAATLGRVLHLTPHDTPACTKLATAARSASVIVSIDLDRWFDGIETLLPLVDVCITSSEFPAKHFGINDPVAGLREIKARYGCPVAGITLGGRGSIFLCGDVLIETKGFAVPGGCVDTTGAGDAFRAGFLYGMLNGETVDESIRAANAVAALKCRGSGARSALPSRQELSVLLENARQ